MTRTTSKKNQLKSGLWSQKKQSTDNIRTQEDPATLTTHPTTSHIKLNQKMEDVRDYLKNNNACMRFLAKNLHVYVNFGQKPACIRDFWPKTFVCT